MEYEPEHERIAGEHRAIEEAGLGWQNRSDEYLVGYVAEVTRPAKFHTPAIVEMQRRQAVATSAFNAQSGEQARDMLKLWNIGLTIVLGLTAFGQLVASVAPLIGRQ